MNKAHYAPDRAVAFDEAFSAEGAFSKQARYLENLIPEGSVYFYQGPKRLAGGIAVAAALDIAVNLQADALDATPKLKAFYTNVIGSPAFAGIKDMGMYFQRR